MAKEELDAVSSIVEVQCQYIYRHDRKNLHNNYFETYTLEDPTLLVRWSGRSCNRPSSLVLLDLVLANAAAGVTSNPSVYFNLAVLPSHSEYFTAIARVQAG